MKFDVQLIEYIGDDSWVEGAIKQISKCLKSSDCPEHSLTGFGQKEISLANIRFFLDSLNYN